MRRTDREVTDPAQIGEILRQGECLHLGLTDGETPYVVPLNYGVEQQGDRWVFYFHGAKAGKKLELIQAHPRAAFCVDTGHALIRGETAASYSYRYACVMGTGTVTLVEDPAEKRRGLACIVAHYAPEQPFDVPEETIAGTAVFRLEAEEVSAKRRV